MNISYFSEKFERIEEEIERRKTKDKIQSNLPITNLSPIHTNSKVETSRLEDELPEFDEEFDNNFLDFLNDDDSFMDIDHESTQTHEILEKSFLSGSNLTKNPVKFRIFCEQDRKRVIRSIIDDFDQKIPDSDFKICDFLLITTKFRDLFRVNMAQVQGFLKIVQTVFNLHLPGYSLMDKKYFSTHCHCCFVCSECNSIFKCHVKYSKFSCQNCKSLLDIHKNSFFHSPFLDYFKISMNDKNFESDILNYKQYQFRDDGVGEFFDGWMFRRLKAEYFAKEDDEDINLSIIFNEDPFAVTKKASFVPFFYSIMNVPRHKRKNIAYNPLVAFCKKNKNPIVFQAVTHLLAKEMKQLMKKQIVKNFRVRAFLTCFLLDLMARYQVLGQIAPTGYHSCCICNVEGEAINKKVKFPLNKDQENDFRTQYSILEDISSSENGFSKGYSQFFLLPYFSPDLICSVDLMHNALEGLGKKLIKCLREEKKNPFKIKKETFQEIEKTICETQFPKYLNLKIPELKNLKAIEILVIIMFCKDCFKIVPNGFYDLMKQLHDITKICFQDIITYSEIQTLEQIVSDFRCKFQEKLGRSSMTHNTHLLCHLPRGIYLFGPSWTNIMFRFEGLNHLLNMTIHTSNNFERRTMVSYNSNVALDQMITQRCCKNPKLRELLTELEKMRQRSNKCLLVAGCRIKKNDWVRLKNGRTARVLLVDKELQSVEVEFFDNVQPILTKIHVNDAKCCLVATFELSYSFDGKIQKNRMYQEHTHTLADLL